MVGRASAWRGRPTRVSVSLERPTYASGGDWTVRSRSGIVSCVESASGRVPDGTGFRFGLSNRRSTTMQHCYPCGGVSRRGFLAASAASVPLMSAVSASAAAQAVGKTSHVVGDRPAPSKFAAPGLYPGRVVEVKNPRMIQNGTKDRAAIQAAMDRGVKELTGATDAVQAWKHFFEPGHVVGIKVVPNGQPYAHSSFEIVLEVIEKLKACGVKAKDMFVYDRYRSEFMDAGYHKVLPSDIRWGGLDPHGNQFTLDFPSFRND